jgi:hypothetical protein
MSHDPNAFVNTVMSHAAARLEERLAEISRNRAKAESIITAMREEERVVRKALQKVSGQPGARGSQVTGRVVEALRDGPLTRQQLLDVLGVNGEWRQVQGSLNSLVRHGRLQKTGDRYEVTA